MIKSEIKKEIEKLYNSGNQQLIDPILHLEETKLKLERKKRTLEEEIENEKNSLRSIAKEPFKYLELHRRHTESVVFSGKYYFFIVIIEWIKRLFQN